MNSQQKREYEENGYVVLHDIFSSEEVLTILTPACRALLLLA
jgi:hypothetical protein